MLYFAPESPFWGPFAPFKPLRAHLSQQAPSGKVDVGQRQGRERTRGVLVKPAIAHLAKAPQPFDHPEYMLYASADAGLVAVLGPLRLIDHPHLRVRWLVKSLALGALPRISAFWLA